MLTDLDISRNVFRHWVQIDVSETDFTGDGLLLEQHAVTCVHVI